MKHDDFSLSCADCGTDCSARGVCECQRIKKAMEVACVREALGRKYSVNLSDLVTEANVEWAKEQRR